MSKSAESLALTLPNGIVRDVQRFLGAGAWDDAAILEKHAGLAAASLGDAAAVLIVDGTDFPKKGKHSAGVARQYCGATGSIDNCQAAVSVAYASRHGHTLLDRRRYLPQDWFGPVCLYCLSCLCHSTHCARYLASTPRSSRRDSR